MAALAALVSACTGPASDANPSVQEQSRPQQSTEEPMKIRIVTTDRTLTAVLDDSAAARDFAALLPIELTLSDYNRTEKIADLPRHLSVDEAPDGIISGIPRWINITDMFHLLYYPGAN
ncbi:cyclophilin-like fold protein [Sphingobium yanoikuyae]|uniref:cyclophilin-like fold protein n=1 Tax=Sphingobium yanoikuyae TaxID=13690 RepID=UPI0035C7D79B